MEEHDKPYVIRAGWTGRDPHTCFLDFLESAPYPRRVEPYSVSLVFYHRSERLVSLPHLRTSLFSGEEPVSPLINHLSIPAGTFLESEMDLYPRIEDHPQVSQKRQKH